MSDPVVTSITPSSGPPGTQVVILGSGFSSVTGMTVGGVVVAPSIVSDTRLTFVVSTAMPVGADDVDFTFTGAIVYANAFTVTVPVIGRDPKLWPGAVGAWPNVAQGSYAVTTPGKLTARTATLAVKAQEIPLNMDPSQPVTAFIRNAGQNGDRCAPADSPPVTLASARFNQALVIPSAQTNYPPAMLGADNLARVEGGNFGHCGVGDPPYAGHFGNCGTIIDNLDVKGGSGGSGMTTLGGTIRYGEFTHGTNGSGDGRIRHTLRIDLAVSDLGQGVDGKGYVWPANKADGGFNQPGNSNYYSGPVKQLVNGALLVIPASVNLANIGLVTAPAKELAWTLQNYGARTANTQHNSTWAIATEWSVVGRVDAEFQALYGFPMEASPSDPFGADMNKLIVLLQVVTNDSSSNVGGGGTPLQPAAPPLAA